MTEPQPTDVALSEPPHAEPIPAESIQAEPITPEPVPAEPVMAAPTEDHLRLAEALIFASAEPVPARALAALLPEDIDADTVLHAVRQRYAGRGVELLEILGLGWQFRTAPDLAPRLTRAI